MLTRLRSRRLFLVLTIVVVGVGLPGVAGAQQTALSPSMTVNPISISAGDKVTVRGEGWPAGQLVDLSICGNGGDGGSANCNRSGAATVGVGGDGEFGATLVGVIPPVACPCVVRGMAGIYTATQPIQVVGAPLRTAPAAIAVPIVTEVLVSGSGPPIAWFGGSPERDVVVTVSNPSVSAVKNARVEVRWGAEGSEQSTVIPMGQDLLPKTSTQIATTIELGALTWGDVEVRARVVTTGDPTWVDASTSSYPWGLLVVTVVLLQFAVIAVVRRNRRARLAREGGDHTPDGPAPSDESTEAAAAVDANHDEADLTETAPDPQEPTPVPGTAGGAAVSTLEREPVGSGRATATQEPTVAGPITAAPWTSRRGT